MIKKTEQVKKWEGRFGKDFTARNIYMPKETDKVYKQIYGVTRTFMNRDFVGNMNKSIKILDVGCNIGNQLLVLQRLGFKNLYGIEIQDYAIELSKKMTKKMNIIKGNALDIPFKDEFFDLVFTSGVLIHISPSHLRDALTEIYRCAKRYIWGFEYYNDGYAEIVYRGQRRLLWKADFPKIYVNTFKDLRLVKEKKFKFVKNDNQSQMFLLEKMK